MGKRKRLFIATPETDEDADYKDLEDGSYWNPGIALDQDTCGHCGYLFHDDDDCYRGFNEGLLCNDCVQIVTLAELAEAWRQVHEPEEG